MSHHILNIFKTKIIYKSKYQDQKTPRRIRLGYDINVGINSSD